MPEASEGINTQEQVSSTEQKGVDKDGLDIQIEMERKRREKEKKDQSATTQREAVQKEEQETQKEKTKSEEDPTKLSVDTEWLRTLRTSDEKKKQEIEKLQGELSVLHSTLKQHFNVDSAQALADKLEEAKKSKEREEESKLSRVEVAEKRAQKLEKQLEEERIKFEQRERELISSRDETIIQTALIQAAVANDVVNPKQLLQLLKDEFVVDPVKRIPVYKAEDGVFSLEERVKVFLEDPLNWNLVSNKIPAYGSNTQGTGGTGGGKQVFTKAELADMRQNRPKEYKERQAEILKAYQEGRVKL